MVTPSKDIIEAELQQSFLTYDDALAAWYAANPYTPPPAPTTPEEYISQITTPSTGYVQTFPYTAATAPTTTAPPLNLEIAPHPIDVVGQNILMSGPGQFVSGALRAGEHIVGPVLEPFISPATGYQYGRYIYDTPTYRAGEAVGTLAIISGGGIIREKAALERGFTKSVFAGSQILDEPYTLTKGVVTTEQARYFGLGKKIIKTDVALKQKAVPITDRTLKVSGLGTAGDNILTTKSIVGLKGKRFESLGIVDVYSPTGARVTTRATGAGVQIDDVILSATRGGGRTIGRTQLVSEAKGTGTIYGSASTETVAAVDTALSTKMMKTTTKQIPPVIPTRARIKISPTRMAPAKQRLRQEVVVSSKQRKAVRQQLTTQVAKVPRQRQVPTSAVMQLPKQKPISITIPKVTPISRQRDKVIPIQRQPQVSRAAVKPIPLDAPMKAPSIRLPPIIRAPAPFWPTIIRPSPPRQMRTTTRRKLRRKTEYTPTLSAWVGNIRRKLSRQERKARFTGFEVRPIPLDKPIKRKSRKKTKRRRKK